jgi:esterase/lipase
MANLATTSYKDRYERAKHALSNLRQASKAPLQAVVVTGSGAIGGILAGAIDAKMPLIGPVPITPALGAILCAGSWINAEESWAVNLNAAGSTMLGVWLARQTHQVLTAP